MYCCGLVWLPQSQSCSLFTYRCSRWPGTNLPISATSINAWHTYTIQITVHGRPQDPEKISKARLTGRNSGGFSTRRQSLQGSTLGHVRYADLARLLGSICLKIRGPTSLWRHRSMSSLIFNPVPTKLAFFYWDEEPPNCSMTSRHIFVLKNRHCPLLFVLWKNTNKPVRLATNSCRSNNSQLPPYQSSPAKDTRQLVTHFLYFLIARNCPTAETCSGRISMLSRLCLPAMDINHPAPGNQQHFTVLNSVTLLQKSVLGNHNQISSLCELDH